jgi:hypothetical protein
MFKRIAPVLAILAAGMGMSSVAMSDPGLPDVPKHRHYIQQPDGSRSETGPRVCDNPNVQNAFNQYHSNAHRPLPGAPGPAAPGLHNGQGGELVFGPC